LPVFVAQNGDDQFLNLIAYKDKYLCRDVAKKKMFKVKAEKLSLYQAIVAHRVVRGRGSHHFLGNRLTDGGKVVSLAAP
jgi:hypothetical protein